jgi:hypothetical protein
MPMAPEPPGLVSAKVAAPRRKNRASFRPGALPGSLKASAAVRPRLTTAATQACCARSAVPAARCRSRRERPPVPERRPLEARPARAAEPSPRRARRQAATCASRRGSGWPAVAGFRHRFGSPQVCRAPREPSEPTSGPAFASAPLVLDPYRARKGQADRCWPNRGPTPSASAGPVAGQPPGPRRSQQARRCPSRVALLERCEPRQESSRA